MCCPSCGELRHLQPLHFASKMLARSLQLPHCPITGEPTMNREMQIRTLLENLGDRREGMRNSAMNSLVRMGLSVVPALISALAETHASRKEWAVITLVKIGAPAIPLLNQALRTHHDNVTRWAIASVIRFIVEHNANCRAQAAQRQ